MFLKTLFGSLVLLATFFGKYSEASGRFPTTVGLDDSFGQYDDLKIRVKIFPHKRDYLPQRKDRKRQYLRLSSDRECRIYEGAKGQAAKIFSSYHSQKEIILHSINLDTPLWIECDAPTVLHRASGLASYKYKGNFYVYRHYNLSHKEFEVVVVNILGIEDYLRGVVPAEVFTSWPEESLKSQAVAARTYALFHLSVARRAGSRPYNNFYDVNDTILFQAYTGLTDVDPRTDRAIEQTESMILTHHNKLIQAYYHADSGGGKTESASAVWGVDVPYARSKPEPFKSGHHRSIRWRVETDKIALTKNLRSIGVLSSRQSVKRLAPLRKHMTSTGRVKKLLLTTNDGSYKVISIHKLRKVITLNSNRFSMQSTKDGFIFLGKGSGHGVGMNQKGSQVLAKLKGWGFERILSHYYSRTKLCSLKAGATLVTSCSATQPQAHIKVSSEI
ncbi:SpoIID/LytB domain-containing protein [Oligoflexaceae bacterium]|nr:SpoIID/LytB domain-containing protein [Oligoflexaceae bacterium]